MAKGGSIGYGTLLLSPIVVYMTMAIAVILLGAWALLEDHGIVHHVCGQTYHVWKFGFLNVMLWLFSTISYCAWKSGGEGARARALVLTIFYFAFFTWGILMGLHISDACTDILNTQYHGLYVFHRVCTIMNGLTAFMYLLHETFVGTPMLKSDLTILPDINLGSRTPFEHAGPMVNGAGPAPNNMPTPVHPPTDLSPQLSYEYEKIMQNGHGAGSTSTLPQTTP